MNSIYSLAEQKPNKDSDTNMNLDLLIENLRSPALLFFLLGLIAVRIKSDFEIPSNSSKFISIYLLFSIGFKGGHELAISSGGSNIAVALITGVVLAAIVPIVSFFVVKKKFNVYDAGAVAASYGSVSAVTFITVIGYLELNNIENSGYMIAVMAIMEAPAIIVGTLLIRYFDSDSKKEQNIGEIIKHSVTNGSVLLIIGSLIIGYVSNEKQALGIEPFTTDIFKGFLAVFLLDMGVKSGKKLQALYKNGAFPIAYSIVFPAIIGSIVAALSTFLPFEQGDRLLITVLAASASYIAVPAAMKMAAPKANPGLYVPMALGITFPFNITFGIPLYHAIINLV